MITYCKKCDINWIGLKNIEHEDLNEVYEVCPLCNSLDHLEAGNDLTAYICNPVTGRITDYETGELMPRKPTILPEHKKKHGYFIGREWYPFNSYSKNPHE